MIRKKNTREGVLLHKVNIHEHERIDELGIKDLRIIQNPQAFCFGMDAVLLSDYVKIQKHEKKIIDLGTGTGIIPTLLCGKSEAPSIIGVEIQESMVEMARRSVLLNGLEERLQILQGDLKNILPIFGPNTADVVTSNPPYMNEGGGIENPEDTKAIARHEIKCTLEDVISSASKLLKGKGRFIMVHRPTRLPEIIEKMKKYKLEPKRMRLVYPKLSKEPNMVLIEGVKAAKPFLKIDPPLIVYRDDGEYTDEIYKIYNMKRK